MQVLNSSSIAQETLGLKNRKFTLGLVPTMGCLHRGHLELIRLAQQKADKVVVSIFVNPLQFGPEEDFQRYPRTLEEDKKLLSDLKVDFVFVPEAKDLYPEGFSSQIDVGPLGQRLCGQFRPGHFNGVATVCLKLFQITQADLAIFGEKDFQQLQVIRNCVRDFNLPISIISHPTVREPDGLALSSRNRYLTEFERQKAVQIPLALRAGATLFKNNPDCLVEEIYEISQKYLEGLEVQYLELTHTHQLEKASLKSPIKTLEDPRLLVAAHLGSTRLIDNLSLKDFA